jgi:hypothetical protein
MQDRNRCPGWCDQPEPNHGDRTTRTHTGTLATLKGVVGDVTATIRAARTDHLVDYTAGRGEPTWEEGHVELMLTADDGDGDWADTYPMGPDQALALAKVIDILGADDIAAALHAAVTTVRDAQQVVTSSA